MYTVIIHIRMKSTKSSDAAMDGSKNNEGRSENNNSKETILHFCDDTEIYLPSFNAGSLDRRMTDKIWDKRVVDRAPLYRAALTGEWEAADAIFKEDSRAITSEITLLNETALHVAVGAGHSLGFVEKLVSLICKEQPPSLSSPSPLSHEDLYGNTALAVAAIVGNVKAAEILVGKDERLPLVKNKVNYSPLLLAAKYGHKDMILYLLTVTKDEGVFTAKPGARLLNLLIAFDFYDIGLEILKRQPNLAVEQDQYKVTALQMMAEKPDVFDIENRLSFWQRIIHPCVVVEETIDAPLPMQMNGDVENPPQISNHAVAARNPLIKKIYETKRMQMLASKLVKRLCEEALNIGGNECAILFSSSILLAAKMGTLEVATQILRVYPYAIWFRDHRLCNIFQLAVLHRQEKIYNLIHQMTSHKHFAIAFLDVNDNNILHLAGELAPSDRISGAALQLQRELQWFKEVERLVQPSYRSMKNKDEKTPKMIFSERHEGLVQQGEKWMKITATSCSVVAALIATVTFTAVFTVPGGNNSDQGIPILIHHKSFMAFAFANALALITSAASVEMFLAILTSRYAEDDFLKVLPTRLILGLITLFVSISSMVAAFSASLYLVLVHQVKLVLLPVILFALIPIILFAFLQFPLLLQMVSSTYGRSIFGLQSKGIIH